MENFGSLVILLGVSVGIVSLFERLKMPSILAYLYVGLAIGPHGLGMVEDPRTIAMLGQFGLVFLLFTVGLEFSLPMLFATRWIALGLGGGMHAIITLVSVLIFWILGLPLIGGAVAGLAISNSATALIVKQLMDQGEQGDQHGRTSTVVSIFGDIISIMVLVLIPVLGAGGGGMVWWPVIWTLVKIILMFTVFFMLGQLLLRPLFHEIASTQSMELFTLTVLLVIILSAWVSDIAQLSLVLGAFIGGIVLGETEFRHQVESAIQPFQDVLLGLFFVSVGMLMDIVFLLTHLWQVLLVTFAIVVIKAFSVVVPMRLAKTGTPKDAFRTGIVMAQASEFGFAVMILALSFNMISNEVSQILLGAIFGSIIISPLLIRFNGPISTVLLKIFAARTGQEAEPSVGEEIQVFEDSCLTDHAIILGFGPTGQNLARTLEVEGIAYIALDLDPDKIAQARAAGQSVVFGDASRSSILEVMGIDHAKLVVITMDNPDRVVRAIRNVRKIRPEIPICVRAKEDVYIDKFVREGATEVVPENLEASLMLTSHCLSMLDVPMSKVMRYTREARKDGYRNLRGFFYGKSQSFFNKARVYREQLKTVVLMDGAYAVGRSLEDLDLEQCHVSLTAIRRKNIRVPDPAPEVIFKSGDVLVLFGVPEELERAESIIMGGQSLG